MNKYSDYLLEPDQLESFSSTAKVSPNAELSLLEWAQNRGDLFLPPEIRIVNTSWGSVIRATVQSAATSEKIIGCGRSLDMTTALSCAYGEVVERHVARDVSSAMDEINVIHTEVKGEAITVLDSKLAPLPPRRLRSSNGWAVHFDLVSAARNAIKEAFERHILLYTFLKYGWSGFMNYGRHPEHSKSLLRLLSRVEFAEHRAGMVIAELQNFPGFTTGYFCETNLISKNACWQHASLEALEPALSIDEEKESSLIERLRSEDPLECTQMYYVFQDPPFSFLGTSERETINLKPSAEVKLVLICLHKSWALPFPFYAAYAFSETLIPLTFNHYLQQCSSSRTYMQQILSAHSLNSELPNVHPII